MSDASNVPSKREPATQPWQWRGNWAQWVSAIVACVALASFFLQLNAIRNNSREANARQLYSGYMDAGLRYPEFLKPDYAAIKTNETRLAQYRWFVQYLLFAYDEVFNALGEDGWLQAFRSELRPHLPLLCDLGRENILAQYYSRTAEIVRAEIRAAKESLAECANVRL
jgi:hypothetical protein